MSVDPNKVAEGPLMISRLSRFAGSDNETKLVAIPFLMAPAPFKLEKPRMRIPKPIPPEPGPCETFQLLVMT
jgi:hypothetical protein